MTPCQCTILDGGYCERHAIYKTAHWVELCRTREAYWMAWELGKGPGQCVQGVSARRPPVPSGGPGTELTKLLAKVGIVYTRTCPCKNRSMIMDTWGPAKCREQTPKIVGWMREEADKRSLPFIEIAARGLVLLAIRRAEKKERARKSLPNTDSAVRDMPSVPS